MEPVTSYGSMNVAQQPQHEDVNGASSTHSSLPRDDAGRSTETTPLIGQMSNVQQTFCDKCRKLFHCDRRQLLFVCFTLSSVVSLVLVFFAILYLFVGSGGYLKAFTICRLCYWLFLLLAAFIGYAVSFRFPSDSINLNGFEYFVIFSSIGPVLQSIFTFVATLKMGDLIDISTGTFLAEEVINMLQIGTQVAFYAHAKSVQTDIDEEMSCYQLKRSILQIVLAYFAVCNFAVWAENSFIEIRSSGTSWQKQYYDNWTIIYNIFNPLALVFRFNSFLLFLNVFLDKRR